MCFGNDDPPPAPQFSAPPPPPEIMDVIDEITGTQTITVTDASGKKRRVTSRLPRSAEEEQRYKTGEEIISRSIQNIRELYRYDPASVVDFAPIINTFADINQERMKSLGQVANIGNIAQDVQDFKKMQSTLIDEEFARVRRETNEDLIHRGVSDSTSANEFRAALAKNETMARQQGDIQASLYGEDLANRRLQRNARAFALEEMGREGKLQEANTQYALKRQEVEDLERKRQTAIQENKGNLAIGSGLVGQDLAKALGGQTAQLANQTFAMQSADQLGRYNADVNRTRANYEMALGEYNNRPPSFGDFALQAGGAIGGAMLTANPGSAAGMIGTRLVGGLTR